MIRKIINTGDGSTTIHLPEWNESYHSIHGAIQEARHVFIDMGLKHVLTSGRTSISILEIGFGTGLNALVTWQETQNIPVKVDYNAIEAYPVLANEVRDLNFSSEIKEEKAREIFDLLHTSPWESPVNITPDFIIHKQEKFFQDIKDREQHHLIYFDAFGARVQPELWTATIFSLMYEALVPGGVLVTYAAKGSVRRAMLEVGFSVEKLPGPPGKREMLRAVK